jgi:hypothetical protein
LSCRPAVLELKIQSHENNKQGPFLEHRKFISRLSTTIQYHIWDSEQAVLVVNQVHSKDV